MKVDWILWNLNFLSFRRLESFLELQVYLRRLHRRLCHWCEEQSFLENRIHLMTSDSTRQKQQKMSSLLGTSAKSKKSATSCQNQTCCELMINCFREISSLSAGLLSVDLGVGTGFLFVAGEPGVTSAL